MAVDVVGVPLELFFAAELAHVAHPHVGIPLRMSTYAILGVGRIIVCPTISIVVIILTIGLFDSVLVGVPLLVLSAAGAVVGDLTFLHFNYARLFDVAQVHAGWLLNGYILFV